MSRVLFLSPPSFEGFDGGAGSRYQARREVTSFWYPTWLAQPAALIEDSKLLDCPPHHIGVDECVRTAAEFDHVIIHTSTPSLRNDCRIAEAIKQIRPDVTIGFVGPHPTVLPTETLRASWAIDWVARKEFDYTCKEVVDGKPMETIRGISFRTKNGEIRHNPDREPITDLDALPWVGSVYKRDLKIENYYIGYLLHPYVSLYTGRGCPAKCTFCLWPQTIGGGKYRVRSADNVAREMAFMKELFPQVKEFFFDDDTFTANLPRAREIARKLAPLGITWSCNSRANLDYETIRELQNGGLRLLLVGFESGNEQILKNIRKGITKDQMRRFVQACNKAGVLVHGTFVLGLPVETPETIEETIRFAQELDIFSIQVSLAAPYPGTELYEQAKRNGWFAKGSGENLVRETGYQDAMLEYPGLTKEEIFEAVERFYHRWYFRPRPILRIIETMLEDKEVCFRRLRQGYEFFRSMAQRRRELEASGSITA